MLTNTRTSEAHTLIAIETIWTGTYVPALCAVTLDPLLAGIGITQVQFDLRPQKDLNKNVRK